VKEATGRRGRYTTCEKRNRTKRRGENSKPPSQTYHSNIAVSNRLHLEHFATIRNLVKGRIDCFQELKDLFRCTRGAPGSESCHVSKHDGSIVKQVGLLYVEVALLPATTNAPLPFEAAGSAFHTSGLTIWFRACSCSLAA
jgi:hypothetical protein